MSVELKSTKWLERYLRDKVGQVLSLDNKRYAEVRNFLFLWNIYEREFLEHQCSVGRIWSNYMLFSPEPSVVEEYYIYLVKKYSPEVDFNRLNFIYDGGTYEYDVKKIIMKESPSDDEKRRVCMMVIWRYRNNLFHGRKEISLIWKQGDIFRAANKFLLSGLSKKTGVPV